MATLSSRVQINPEISAFLSGAAASLKSAAARTQANAAAPQIIVAIIFVVALVFLLIWYGKKQRLFENPANIKRISRDSTQAQVEYAKLNPKRKGLRAYLNDLQRKGVPASHMALTNFYVSTVNATGIFFPAENGVASAEAARAAVLAGARGFVLDIWPDLTPGAGFAPSIQVVEQGSLWRRISLNILPLSSVLQALAQEAFMGQRPGSEDPLFLYLRFRGKPRAETYASTAAAIRATLEQYRLDSSFNGCRGQDRIFSTPITQLFRRVIVFSNTRADRSPLSDFINVGPKDGIKLEWGPKDARGLTMDMQADAIGKIKQNLTWVSPFSEDVEAEANSYDWAAAQAVGIQFTGMNFWNRNDSLKKYMGPDMFGVQSFAIKPEKLRYTIELIADPKMPQDPKWGSGTTAGTMKDPPSIKLP